MFCSCAKHAKAELPSFRDFSIEAMDPISIVMLSAMLNALTPQELRDIYGLVCLQLPWVLIELVIHSTIIRRVCHAEFDAPLDISAIEFFAGDVTSSQIAKAFTELGLFSLAFDIRRPLVYMWYMCIWISVKLQKMQQDTPWLNLCAQEVPSMICPPFVD